MEEQPYFCGRAVISVQMSMQILMTDIVGKMYFLIYYYYSLDYINNINAPKIEHFGLRSFLSALNLPGCKMK